MTNQIAQYNPQSIDGLLQVDGIHTVDLQEIWRALNRRKKLVGITAAWIIAITFMVTGYQRLFRPIYQGSFTLLIDDPITSNSGTNSSTQNGRMFEMLALNNPITDTSSLIALLRSPLVLAPIAERFNSSTQAIASNLKITGGSSILKVNLNSQNTNDQLLKAISEAYLKVAIEERQERLTDGLNFLNLQAPAIEKKVDEIQTELADFRIKHSFINPTNEGQSLKGRETSYSEEVLSLEAGRIRLSSIRKDIINGTITTRGFKESISGLNNSDVGSSNGLAISGVDQPLLNELLQVEAQLADARSKYLPSSSMVTGLEARINQLKPLIFRNQLEAVDSALKLNQGRLETAQQQVVEINKEFLKKPFLIKEYQTLERRLQEAQKNLTGLASAKESFQLEIAQNSHPWRVINPPKINPNPIKPSVPKSLALGTILGLVTGIGIGLLRDRQDHVFHRPSEVKAEMGDLPILGHIPFVEFFKAVRTNNQGILQQLTNETQADGGDTERKSVGYKRSFYQESFRALLTSLRFLCSDRKLRSIVISSSIPNEGKSLITTLLAKTISEMGHRVLLIDADFRKPTLHTLLGLNNIRGLSNLLTDDGFHWREVLQIVDDYEDWSVITAGWRPPDPARLLGSKQMYQLVRDLEDSDEFDYILFDTSPLLGLSDSSLLAEHCDGLMLIISLNQVDRNLPKETVNRVRSSSATLLGIVTNAITKKAQESFSFYGYGKYGYGDYGYADANDNDSVTDSARSKPSQLDQDEQSKTRTIRQRWKVRWAQFMAWLDN